MMLSPWFAPRYLWAAIEGAAGLNVSAEAAWLYPHLAAQWKGMGVQNLPYRGRWLTWFVARTPDVHIYTNYHFQESVPYTAYEEDISARIHVTGDAACGLGLRQHDHLLLFVGNTAERTLTTALRVEEELSGAYRCRLYDSLANQWVTWEDLVPAETLHRGLAVQLERKGFWVLDLRQEV